jgi:hypothetical protein
MRRLGGTMPGNGRRYEKTLAKADVLFRRSETVLQAAAAKQQKKGC